LDALRNKAKARLKANGKAQEASLLGPTVGHSMNAIKRANQIERIEQHQRAVEEGYLRAVQGLHPGSVKTPSEAWSVLAEKRAELAYSIEAEGSNAAHNLLVKLAGLEEPERSKVLSGPQAIQVNVTIEAGAHNQAQALVEGRWSELLQLPEGEDVQAPGDAQVDE